MGHKQIDEGLGMIDAKLAEPKAVQRSVNETLAECKDVLKEVKQVRSEIALAYLEAAAKMEIIMENAVKNEVGQLGEKTKKAMDDAVDKVNAEFDRLKDILLGTGPEKDGDSIPELIEKLPTCRRCGRKDGPKGHKCERVVPDAT